MTKMDINSESFMRKLFQVKETMMEDEHMEYITQLAIKHKLDPHKFLIAGKIFENCTSAVMDKLTETVKEALKKDECFGAEICAQIGSMAYLFGVSIELFAKGLILSLGKYKDEQDFITKHANHDVEKLIEKAGFPMEELNKEENTHIKELYTYILSGRYGFDKQGKVVTGATPKFVFTYNKVINYLRNELEERTK